VNEASVGQHLGDQVDVGEVPWALLDHEGRPGVRGETEPARGDRAQFGHQLGAAEDSADPGRRQAVVGGIQTRRRQPLKQRA